MKYKKIMALLTILFISCSLSACGDGQNDVFQESNTTTINEETETEKEEEKEESEGTEEETAITKESESQKETETEESKEQEKETETKESKTSQSAKESTPKQQEETKPVETTPTPTPHTHNYSSSVIANPTCNSNGSIKYVCSCGDNYSEIIPATGQHNWITQYEEVYHESKGEMQQVQVGTSDRYVECAGCGATFSTDADFDNHRKSFLGTDNGHAVAHCYVHSGEPLYELQYVVIQPEWTEQVPYNVCATCGARQ